MENLDTKRLPHTTDAPFAALEEDEPAKDDFRLPIAPLPPALFAPLPAGSVADAPVPPPPPPSEVRVEHKVAVGILTGCFNILHKSVQRPGVI